MSYRAVIVGLGQIGMGYDLDADPKARIATLARAFSEHPAFELVGGVDPDATRRELFRQHYACTASSDVDSAIETLRPEVVAIAAPTGEHGRVLRQVIGSPGLRAVLCEKPLSYDVDEAADMVALAAESGVRLFTNYMRRCDSAVIEVRQRIRDGKIAGPIKGVCWYSKGLFNNGSHFVNLLQYWLGEVRGVQIVESGRLWEKRDPEPDLIMEFDSGKVYFLAAREEQFSHYTVELVAANGRLRYERGSMQWQAAVSDRNNAGYVTLDAQPEMLASDAWRLQWCVADQIARSLAGGETSICTGADGLSTMQVLAQVTDRL